MVTSTFTFCLHWFVISIACFTRLEIFQCPERKNIWKKKKKGSRKPPKLEQILSQSIGLRKGALPPNTPVGWAYSLMGLILGQASHARL